MSPGLPWGPQGTKVCADPIPNCACGQGTGSLCWQESSREHNSMAETFQNHSTLQGPLAYRGAQGASEPPPQPGEGLSRAAARVSPVAVANGKTKCQSEDFHILVYLGNSLFCLFLTLLRETEAQATSQGLWLQGCATIPAQGRDGPHPAIPRPGVGVCAWAAPLSPSCCDPGAHHSAHPLQRGIWRDIPKVTAGE